MFLYELLTSSTIGKVGSYNELISFFIRLTFKKINNLTSLIRMLIVLYYNNYIRILKRVLMRLKD